MGQIVKRPRGTERSWDTADRYENKHRVDGLWKSTPLLRHIQLKCSLIMVSEEPDFKAIG